MKRRRRERDRQRERESQRGRDREISGAEKDRHTEREGGAISFPFPEDDEGQVVGITSRASSSAGEISCTVASMIRKSATDAKSLPIASA